MCLSTGPPVHSGGPPVQSGGPPVQRRAPVQRGPVQSEGPPVQSVKVWGAPNQCPDQGPGNVWGAPRPRSGPQVKVQVKVLGPPCQGPSQGLGPPGQGPGQGLGAPQVKVQVKVQKGGDAGGMPLVVTQEDCLVGIKFVQFGS